MKIMNVNEFLNEIVDQLAEGGGWAKEELGLYYVSSERQEKKPSAVGTLTELERWAAKKGLKFKKDNSLFGRYFYNPTEDESDPGYGDSYAVDIIDKEYD